MHRRNILLRAATALGAAFAASRANAATENPAQDKLKVVYHLNDLDKVTFVIGNIQNHLDGVGGPDHVTIALVVHGPALRAFHSAQANPDLTQHVGKLSKAGRRICRLRQHHEVAECRRSAICCPVRQRRPRRRGAHR